MSNIKIFKGEMISPVSKDKLNYLKPGFMAVSAEGKILEISKKNIIEKYKNCTFIDYKDKLIIPGFIDIHNHLPQFALSGIYKGKLINWLNNLIFPEEKKFSSLNIAQTCADKFFNYLVSNGTTTAVTYVTVHKKATDIAFQQAAAHGIRAFLGNVLMDINIPDYFPQNHQELLKESEELIDKWNNYDNGRLKYIITPRFALSCSYKLLKTAGNLARKYDLFIQSHLSENKSEIDMVKKLYNNFKNITEIYYKAGLCSDKTIMAHCLHLEEEESEILKKTDTKICHCPSSNRFLQSGIMPYRDLVEKGLNIGLGTDIAGGYSLSMFAEMKEAIETSKTLQLIKETNDNRIITPSEAFYLATLGNAKIISMDKIIGSLEQNKSADFIVVDYQKLNVCNNQNLFTDPENILSKLIYSGNKDLINAVYIRGKCIYKN